MDWVKIAKEAGFEYACRLNTESLVCMQEAMNILKPLLAQSAPKAAGKVVMGTVKGDLHDIGKNIVKIMVGGAPLSQEYCDKIGADFYTPDAASASRLAASL